MRHAPSRVLIAVAITLLAVCLAQTAAFGQLTPYTEALASCPGGVGGSPIVNLYPPAVPSTQSCNVTVNNADALGSESASSSANYGTLGILASASATAGSIPAASSAQFVDAVNASGFTGSAFLRLTAGLSGSITVTSGSATNPGTGGYSTALQVDISSPNVPTQECVIANQQSGQCTVLFPVTPGLTANISMFLVASVQANGAVTVTADFSHTGLVQGLQVVDSNGNPISGAQIISTSGTVYPSSATVAFSSFGAKLDISGGSLPGFDLNAVFTLGGASNGINPLTQPVTLIVGTYSVTIPSGSFSRTKKGYYVYQGVIGGVNLQVQIVPLGSNTFRFLAEAAPVNLSSVSNPVAVTITIGADSGTKSVTAEVQ